MNHPSITLFLQNFSRYYFPFIVNSYSLELYLFCNSSFTLFFHSSNSPSLALCNCTCSAPILKELKLNCNESSFSIYVNVTSAPKPPLLMTKSLFLTLADRLSVLLVFQVNVTFCHFKIIPTNLPLNNRKTPINIFLLYHI